MRIINLFREILNPRHPPKNVMATMEKVSGIAFPRGNEQISEEAEMLYAVLNKRVSVEDLKAILVATKPLFYLKNCRQKGNIIRIHNSIFENRSKTSISEMDINLILKFYENYFGFHSEVFENTFSEISAPNILTHVNLYDRDGYFWGCVDFENKKLFKVTETGTRSVYQTILLSAVCAAKRNLSNEDRNIFSDAAMLPKGEWTEVHYNRFAFLFATWLKYFNENSFENEKLNQIKNVLQEFSIDDDVIAKNKLIANVFKKCFVKT